MTATMIFAIAASIFSLLMGVIGFFTVRWMNRVDTSLQKWTEREAHEAAFHAKIEGQIESLHKCIAQSNKDVGSLASSVQKVWDILIASNVAKARPSDKIVGHR